MSATSAPKLSASLKAKYDADIRVGGKLQFPEAQHHIRAVATKLRDEIAAWLGAGNATNTPKSELKALESLQKRCERDIVRNDPDKMPKAPKKEAEVLPPAPSGGPCNYVKLDHYYLTLIVRDDPTAAAVMIQWVKDYMNEKQRLQTAARNRTALTNTMRELFVETQGRLLDSMRGILQIIADPANDGKFSEKMKNLITHQVEEIEKEEF